MDEAVRVRLLGGFRISVGERSFGQDIPTVEPEVARPAAGLTRREEEEVVVLAARGLTNRRISAELSISEHTAATHVSRVLRKLEPASRVELAAWVASGGLQPPK